MHRCLLISEILCTILKFTQQCNESFTEDGLEDQKLGKRTLASLAQTCRAISSPALDRLWVRLDSLDPLIKLLPRRFWSKMPSQFITIFGRMLIGKKHWLRFRQYAVRVQFLHGPCRGIPSSVQFNVVTALARFPKASLPLLPNLTELVWSGPSPLNNADLTVILLVKFFAGPGVTSLSLFLDHWPWSASIRAVLSDLPNICPNVTSFTCAIQWPYPQPDITARYVVDIVRRWPHLQALQISPCCYRLVTTQLASKPTLTTLGILINDLEPVYCVLRLPDSIHTFSLDIHGDWDSLHGLETLQGSLAHFHLRIFVFLSCSQRMRDFLQTLPTHLDNTQLRSLTIEVTHLPLFESFSSLTEPFLESLYAFSALRTLDLSSFCALGLNDAVYARMATMWPELTSLKVGTTSVSKRRPVASVVAVIAVLRSCPHLQTLHIVFNGSIPPPPPVMVEEEENVDVEGVDEGKEERAAVSQVNGWGVANRHITQIHVGLLPVLGRHRQPEGLGVVFEIGDAAVGENLVQD
ncbi:hypothetical protein HD554DRAFT_2174720 [Boletus coccyginus]|nr:hypothetical protein HD554DRAFT_2174720 [Boletus coccyginus]